MKTNFYLLLCILCTLSSNAQNNFQALYNTGTNDGGYLISADQNGLIIADAAFCTDSLNPFFGCYPLIKTDLNGNPLWTRTYFDSYHILGFNMLSKVSSGITGAGSYLGPNGFEQFIASFDEAGDTLSAHIYDSPLRNSVGDLLPLPGGGHIMLGQGKLTDSTTHIYMMKVDGSGTEQWTKVVETGYPQNQPGNIRLLPDGGFIMAAEGSYINNQDDELLLVRMDSLGDTLWVRKYYTADYSVSNIRKVHLLQNGNFLLQDRIDTSFTTFNRPGKLYCTDPDGNLIWQYTIPLTYHVLYNTYVAGNGDIVGGGRKLIIDPDGPFHGENMGWLFRMTQDGELLWNHYYLPDHGNNPGSWFDDLTETPDGGIAAVGFAPDTIGGVGGTDVWLVKVGPDGCYEPGCTGDIVLSPVSSVAVAPVNTENLSLWPNPATEQVSVSLQSTLTKPAIFHLFDPFGREVRREVLSAGQQSAEVGLAGLPPGLYFWSVELAEGSIGSGKLIVIK